MNDADKTINTTVITSLIWSGTDSFSPQNYLAADPITVIVCCLSVPMLGNFPVNWPK